MIHDVDDYDKYLEKSIEAEKLFKERISMNFVAKSICLQAKIKLFRAYRNKFIQRESILDARNTIQKAVDLIKVIFDDSVVDLIKGTNDQIMKDMR